MDHQRRNGNGSEEKGTPREIGREVRNAATRCRKNCRCLEGEEPECRVVDCVADKVFFVEGHRDRICPYRRTFGDSHYCACPVRQKLYRTLQI